MPVPIDRNDLTAHFFAVNGCPRCHLSCFMNNNRGLWTFIGGQDDHSCFNSPYLNGGINHIKHHVSQFFAGFCGFLNAFQGEGHIYPTGKYIFFIPHGFAMPY
jgi:hypothetical protein